MQFISSDTNIWIDFKSIDEVGIPFVLPYKFIMYEEAINDELIVPQGFSAELVKLGLQGVSITEEELSFAVECITKYPKLSSYDSIALAIAKKRSIKLLTGDKRLRNAAVVEKVEIMGTIGVIDELLEQGLISNEKGLEIFFKLYENKENKIRLPEKELKQRIDKLKEQIK